MTPSPSGGHQDAVGRFYHYLFLNIESHGMGKVRIAPFDVELTPKLVVQPDVLVVLKANYDKLAENRVLGAPNLVIEVASPGTATYDRHSKQMAYAQAGVPEYWIADPMARTVEVFVLERHIYTSVGIFEGKATLPSTIVPGLPTPVEQFFA